MGKTIVVVDDMKTLRDMLSNCLTGAGHTVVLAENGVEALEKCSEHNPDFVITDLNMPIMNGIEFIREARTSGIAASIPILLLTTETADKLKQDARDAGATGWLTKPFDPKRVIELVDRLCL